MIIMCKVHYTLVYSIVKKEKNKDVRMKLLKDYEMKDNN